MANVPLDRSRKKRVYRHRHEAWRYVSQCEFHAAASRCPPLQESVRNLDTGVYGANLGNDGADSRRFDRHIHPIRHPIRVLPQHLIHLAWASISPGRIKAVVVCIECVQEERASRSIF